MSKITEKFKKKKRKKGKRIFSITFDVVGQLMQKVVQKCFKSSQFAANRCAANLNDIKKAFHFIFS